MIMGGGIGLILLVVLIWFVITNKNQSTFLNPNPLKETPLEILKKRYARGEITKEEFEEMSKNLR